MSNFSPVRVLLVDDHDVLRQGILVVIEMFEDLKLVGDTGSGREAVSMCERLSPDVVLMDLVMPDMDGVTATKLIRQQNPNVKVIALTSFEDEPLVRSAREAGVSQYLLKNVSIDDIANAIRTAASEAPGAVC